MEDIALKKSRFTGSYYATNNLIEEDELLCYLARTFVGKGWQADRIITIHNYRSSTRG
jgi:hypothetical protein